MSLVSGPIFQVCWVVDDIAAAEQWFTDAMGVPKWHRFTDIRFEAPKCTLRGEPANFVIHVALGYAGDQQLELIQPVSGASLYAEHIAEHGPGLHHVAFIPDDFDAAVEAARTQGIEIEQEGEFAGGGIKYAYLNGSAFGAPHVELMTLPDMMRDFYESLKQ